MQFDINKEVRDYKETLFFGLNLRQCVCSALAIIVASVLYFSLKHRLSNEPLSWVCMLGAAPFAAMGFFGHYGRFLNLRTMEFVHIYASRWGKLVEITDIDGRKYYISCEERNKLIEFVGDFIKPHDTRENI